MTQPIEASPSLNRMTALTAITALFFGIFAVSFAAIFIRVSEQELGPYATIAHRFWIATLALALWAGMTFIRRNLQDQRQQGQSFLAQIQRTIQLPSRAELGLLVLGGTIAAVDLSLWALSLTQTSVANAAVLGNLAPLFTALGTWLLWKKGFDNRFLVGLTLALGGACTIGLGDFQLVPSHVQGDVIALCSAVLFSAYLLTVEQLRLSLTTTATLLGCSAIASVISTGIALGFEDRFFPISNQGWLAVMGLALVSQTLGQGLVAYSLDKLSSSLVAMTFLLEPVMAAAGAWFLFGEHLSLLNGLGFSVVILGIYIAISSQSAIKESPA